VTPLENLVGYLHEDWADDYESAWQGVEHFVQSEPADARRLRAGIESVVRVSGSELQLEDRLFDAGLRYQPSDDGWGSYREWLLAVADRVDELLRGKASESAD
jgi:hypothetical protein